MLKARFVPHTLSRLHQHPPAFSRSFHPSFVKMVKVGDPIPSVELMETSPGTKVDLSKELKGKGLLIGVPAAYSTSTASTTTRLKLMISRPCLLCHPHSGIRLS